MAWSGFGVHVGKLHSHQKCENPTLKAFLLQLLVSSTTLVEILALLAFLQIQKPHRKQGLDFMDLNTCI